jgi:putative ABC transport system permease protein
MLKSYLKMAIRSLMKNKISSILNMLGLTMGLAAGIIMLLVVVDQLNYDHFNINLSDIRLVMNNENLDGTIYTRIGTPGPLAASMRDKIPEIKYAARTYLGGQAIFRNTNKAIYLESIYADPDFFNIMSFPALKGNPATALKEPGSVVLTASSARKLFNNDDPLGKLIVYNNIHNLKVVAIVRDVPQNSSNHFDAL